MRALELLGGLIVAIAIGIGVFRMLVVLCRGMNVSSNKKDSQDEQ